MSQSFHNLKSSAANNKACLSVVMPVYKEAATVEKVVGTVLAQPSVAELIAVDNVSDRTAEILAKMRGDHPRLIRTRIWNMTLRSTKNCCALSWMEKPMSFSALVFGDRKRIAFSTSGILWAIGF